MIILIYLYGCCCSYELIKYRKIQNTHRWTEGDRFGALLASSFSWVSFGISLLAIGIVEIDKNLNSENPASW